MLNTIVSEWVAEWVSEWLTDEDDGVDDDDMMLMALPLILMLKATSLKLLYCCRDIEECLSHNAMQSISFFVSYCFCCEFSLKFFFILEVTASMCSSLHCKCFSHCYCSSCGYWMSFSYVCLKVNKFVILVSGEILYRFYVGVWNFVF